MRCWAGLLALLLLLAERGPEASVSNLQVAPDGNRVLASLVLRNGFGGDLVERLESGLPTPILYRFELARDRKRWYDRGLRESTLEVAAVYDAVTQEYTVNYRLDDKLVDSRTVRERPALERAMTRLEQMPVFTLEGAPRGPRLLVRARAELGTHMVLWVIPARIATPWAESNKFRLPRELP
jgi:hypothetical protein